MFLTILTRTFFGRPRGLIRCIESVMNCPGSEVVQHLLVAEDESHGVGQSFINLRYAIPKIKGEYVMLLDDDDYLLDQSFFLRFSKHIHENEKPPVVIVEMDMGTGLVLPEQMGGAPARDHIACSCYIVRKDIFVKYIESFTNTYDGDFNFINDVWCGKEQFTYLPVVAAKVGTVSHGQPENSNFGAVVVPSGGVPSVAQPSRPASEVSGESGKQPSVRAPGGLYLTKPFRH